VLHRHERFLEVVPSLTENDFGSFGGFDVLQKCAGVDQDLIGCFPEDRGLDDDHTITGHQKQPITTISNHGFALLHDCSVLYLAVHAPH
jgi:hypothetical protein